jgi:hypothetical protein
LYSASSEYPESPAGGFFRVSIAPAPGTGTNSSTTLSRSPEINTALRGEKSLTRNFPRRGKVRAALRTLQLFCLSLIPLFRFLVF